MLWTMINLPLFFIQVMLMIIHDSDCSRILWQKCPRRWHADPLVIVENRPRLELVLFHRWGDIVVWLILYYHLRRLICLEELRRGLVLLIVLFIILFAEALVSIAVVGWGWWDREKQAVLGEGSLLLLLLLLLMQVNGYCFHYTILFLHSYNF